MQIYNVDIRKLALMLLPNALRKPILFAILRAAVKPITTIKGKFDQYRHDVDFRMKHTSQVCYLVALLNEKFGIENDTFEIQDTNPVSGEWMMTYDEEFDNDENNINDYIDIIPLIEVYNHKIFYTEDAIKEITEDFIVLYPSEAGITKYNDKYNKMQELVETYRLVSKLPRYVLKTE